MPAKDTLTATNSRRRRLPLLSLLAADAISGAGNLLAVLALPWFVLETTGSPTKTALTVAVSFLPMVVTGLLGGALVDRVGYRKMSIASDLASAVSVAAIPALHHTIGLEFWQLLALVFLGALLDSPGSTARSALYPELAQDGGVSLERANTAQQVVRRVSGLLSPPLAGVLIATLGPAEVLWLDAVSFLISAGIVLVAVSAPRAAAVADAGTSYLNEIVEGWRFLRRERVVSGILLVAASGSLLAEPLYLVVLPILANQVYDSSIALGMTFASLAAGSLAGNAFYFALGPRLPRRPLLLVGYSVRAVTFCLLPFSPPLWALCVSIFINAMALEPANPIYMTILQERVPAGMRGRVFGILRATVATALPVGIMMYGVLIGAAGLNTTLAVLAVLNVCVPLTVWLAPGLQDLAPPAAAKSPAPPAA